MNIPCDPKISAILYTIFLYNHYNLKMAGCAAVINITQVLNRVTEQRIVLDSQYKKTYPKEENMTVCDLHFE